MRSLPPPHRALPDAPPYYRVRSPSGEIVLRAPDLIEVGRIFRGLSDRGRNLIAGAAVQFTEDPPFNVLLGTFLAAGPELVAVLAGLLGVAWRDPALELEAARPTEWSEASLLAYGEAVYAELYEAGWTLSHLVKAALSVAARISAASSLEDEVRREAAFFVPRRADPPADRSQSSADSSGASTVDDSVS